MRNHPSKPILLCCLDLAYPTNCGWVVENWQGAEIPNFCLTDNDLGIGYVLSGMKWETVVKNLQTRERAACEENPSLLPNWNCSSGLGMFASSLVISRKAERYVSRQSPNPVGRQRASEDARGIQA